MGEHSGTHISIVNSTVQGVDLKISIMAEARKKGKEMGLKRKYGQ